MIEFKGNISEECKKYIWNRETKFVSLACIITALIFSGIIIIVALKVDLIILMFLLLTISFAFLGSFPQKGIDERLPQSISIENNEILLVSKACSKSRSIWDIKKITDMGKWYVIDFYFPSKNLFFVCQKDLLIEGCIDDFEKLFEKKITKLKE